jgi:hypothetical protein
MKHVGIIISRPQPNTTTALNPTDDGYFAIVRVSPHMLNTAQSFFHPMNRSGTKERARQVQRSS